MRDHAETMKRSAGDNPAEKYPYSLVRCSAPFTRLIDVQCQNPHTSFDLCAVWTALFISASAEVLFYSSNRGG
jgi:hypothetical protein